MAGEYISRDGVVFTGFVDDNGNSVLQRKIQIRQLEKESLGIRSIVQSLEKEKSTYLIQVEMNQRTVRENRDAFTARAGQCLNLARPTFFAGSRTTRSGRESKKPELGTRKCSPALERGDGKDGVVGAGTF